MIITHFFSILLFISFNFVIIKATFLFWGPRILREYQSPTYEALDQEALIRIYESQMAIVVFVNEDTKPLSSDNVPRLVDMLEKENFLGIYEDYLDVYPHEINNETTIIHLQGSWAERDAEITEVFRRFQQFYGRCRVLGILDHIISQELSAECAETSKAASELEPNDQSGWAWVKNLFYNAIGFKDKNALQLYSSGWPLLTWKDGTVATLSNPRSKQILRPTQVFETLVVEFALDDIIRADSQTIMVEFNFELGEDGWWSVVGAKIYRGFGKGYELLVDGKPPAAPVGSVYHSSQPVVFTDGSIYLTLPNIQVKPFTKYNDTNKPTHDWYSIIVSSLIVITIGLSINVIADIKEKESERNRRKNTISNQLRISSYILLFCYFFYLGQSIKCKCVQQCN